MASRCAFGNDRGVEQSVSLFINIITIFLLCISVTLMVKMSFSFSFLIVADNFLQKCDLYLLIIVTSRLHETIEI